MPAENHRDEAFADAEPPPPYTSIADGHSTTLEANYSRPYEIQDSGAFREPQGPPTGCATSTSFQPPSGPPPPHRRPDVTSSSSYTPTRTTPPQHPSHRHNTSSASNASGGGGSPAAHVDGVSTFNRPALPNQVPAHTVSPVSHARPTIYSPTTTPTSGQPLLYRGKILVYTNGFYCPKCHNTGYKAYDPSAPHIRCWDRYGKPYTSLVQHAPDFTFSNPNLQKPLPNTRYNSSLPPPAPPQQPPMQQHPGYYVAGQHNGPQYGAPPLQRGYYGGMPQPGPFYHQPPAQFGMYSSMNGPHPHMVMGAPPPGSLVVQPGDPRIGGRLCPHCGGQGEISDGGFLFVDYETCRACRGSGRVFW